MPAVRFKAEAHLDELLRSQQVDQERMPCRVPRLKQVGLVGQGELHQMRPLADIAHHKRRPGFGIETYHTCLLDFERGGRKLSPAGWHMDMCQLKADKEGEQGDLFLARGDFIHLARVIGI